MRTTSVICWGFAWGALLCVAIVSDATAAEPSPDAAAKGAAEIKLLDGKTLAGWQILDKIDFDGHGKVEVRDGELVLGMGQPMTGVKWIGPALPRIDYEISLQGRRIEGSDFFCGMTFPVGKSHCSLILGGWGGSLTGLSSVDGFDASENETTNSLEFRTGQWYSIRLRVTQGKIQAWVDNEQIVDLKTTDRKLSLRWEMDPMPPLGFATYATAGGLKNIVVKRLESQP